MTEKKEPKTFWERAKGKWTLTWANYSVARRKARHRRRKGPPAYKTAVFVVGCQRSGTSMTIKNLDFSLDTDRFDETDEHAFDGFRIRDQAVRARLIEASTASCVMFKPVCDAHRVTELMAEHEHAKVIWIFRRYQDAANSAVVRWGDTAQRWLEDLLKGGGDWGDRQWNKEKITEECLDKVRQACSEGLTPHAAAAVFWYMRNRTYFDQNLPDNPDVLLVRYEDVVGKSREEFGRMCDFLGIGFFPEIVAQIFSSSVRKSDFPDIPQPVRELCDGMMERLERVAVQGS